MICPTVKNTQHLSLSAKIYLKYLPLRQFIAGRNRNTDRSFFKYFVVVRLMKHPPPGDIPNYI
jgi:hypothetical protein